MMSADLLPAVVLKRKAVVYVRQSTQAQVESNPESQRRQYEPVDVARSRGTTCWSSAAWLRFIDLDGVYDPCRPSDRLLPGMKGSISEFELGVLRARMLDAARAKARRGELRISVPIDAKAEARAGMAERSSRPADCCVDGRARRGAAASPMRSASPATVSRFSSGCDCRG
ncbi:recombinase family protein [Mesorhizobium sp. M0678]|uniref:recombinase family protein n=1 Tax=Mesorhizobium sp. M0678 TaxID=2956985 RepID=UPI0033359011